MRLRPVGQYERDRATVKIATKAAIKGGRKSKLTYTGTWVPACDDPVKVYRAVPCQQSEIPSIEVDFLVPCRKCKRCLQIRQMQWRDRALLETSQATRTWFITLTFSPAHLAGILAEAALKVGRLSYEAAQERVAYSHLQRYFKRLRKNAGPFRFLAVFERGEKTGRAHYHVLLHERDRPITKRQIDFNWRSHVHARLVNEGDGSAAYITKYTTKSLSVRIRASLGYGKSPSEHDQPQFSLSGEIRRPPLPLPAATGVRGGNLALKKGFSNGGRHSDIQNSAPEVCISEGAAGTLGEPTVSTRDDDPGEQARSAGPHTRRTTDNTGKSSRKAPMDEPVTKQALRSWARYGRR